MSVTTATAHLSTSSQGVLTRIARVAGILRTLTWLIVLVQVFFLLILIAWLVWWLPTAPNYKTLLDGLELSKGSIQFNLSNRFEWSVASKIVFFSYLSLFVFYYWYCVSRMHNLFGYFKKHEIYTQRNSKLLRQFGYALIIGFVFSWLPFVLLKAIVWYWEYFDFPHVTFYNWESFANAVLGDFKHVDISSVENFFKSLMLVKLNFRLDLGLTAPIMISAIFLAAWIIDIGRELYIESEYTI